VNVGVPGSGVEVMVEVLVAVPVAVTVAVMVAVAVRVAVGGVMINWPLVTARGTVVAPLLDCTTVMERGNVPPAASARTSKFQFATTPLPAGMAAPPPRSKKTTLILPSGVSEEHFKPPSCGPLLASACGPAVRV
jgi:hypothetical protein